MNAAYKIELGNSGFGFKVSNMYNVNVCVYVYVCVCVCVYVYVYMYMYIFKVATCIF